MKIICCYIAWNTLCNNPNRQSVHVCTEAIYSLSSDLGSIQSYKGPSPNPTTCVHSIDFLFDCVFVHQC
jgi:hypothetical protein